MNSNIQVRDLLPQDIPLIADYWLHSSNEHLEGMGVDLNKLPKREDLVQMLESQLQLDDDQKASLALIVAVDGKAAGHCNVNQITFGKEATMHLHLWNSDIRHKGIGTEMVLKSIPQFFERLQLKTLWCEPYAHNPAPNKTLQKIGFEFVKTYICVPGSLNFEQEVNQYKLSRENLEKIQRDHT
ncbi:MAG: GNAT family N-acetyltransferase [Flavobacteriales bacterium]|nr:GNAT family N-acetyltransferase [Flavobacteriales bacterium]